MDQKEEISRLQRELLRLQQQIDEERLVTDRWKKMAAWLITCHAATLIGLPKYAPKCMRRRLTSICKKIILFHGGRWAPRPRHPGLSASEEVVQEIARCSRAIDEHGLAPKRSDGDDDESEKK